MTELESSPHWLPNEDLLRVFHWSEIFGNNHPVEVDLGAGDGSFALGWIQQHPEINLVAVERLLGRARKIVKNSERLGLTNIRLLRLESAYFLERMCEAESISRIHIMFPDPWPKRRHFPNRLMQPHFIDVARRALMTSGELRFTTDHEEYFKWTCRQWKDVTGWSERREWDASQDPKSDFQQDFEADGRPVFRGCWEKI